MAHTSDGRLGRTKRFALRIQTKLHTATVRRDGKKFHGGFTEIVERLLVGNYQNPGLAEKSPRKFKADERA